ncbi:MAG: chloride channel protein [Bacillota bacterium]
MQPVARKAVRPPWMLSVYKSLQIGLVAGLVIYGFAKVAASFAYLNLQLFSALRAQIIYWPLGILFLLLIAFVADRLVWNEPNAGGSSISRVTRIVKDNRPIAWLRVTIFTVLATLLMFFSGSPLGIEGPSVMVGAGVSSGLGNRKERGREEDRDALILAGAAAGFTAVTGAFLASVVFVLEEIHKKLCLHTALLTMVASSMAFLVYVGLNYWMGHPSHDFFHFTDWDAIGFFSPWLWVAGLGGAILAKGFNLQMEFGNRWFARYMASVPRVFRYFYVLLFIMVLGLFVHELLGSGHATLFGPLFSFDHAFTKLVVLLILKTFLIALANASDMPGGMFVPTLVIAGLYGAILSMILFRAGLSPAHGPIFTLAFMAAFFSASMKAPLTAMLFFTEVTLFATASLAVLPAIGVSTLVSMALSTGSVNDLLIETNDVLKLASHRRRTFRVVLKANESFSLPQVHKTLKKEAIHLKGVNFKDDPFYTELTSKKVKIGAGDALTLDIAKEDIHKLESTLKRLYAHCELDLI